MSKFYYCSSFCHVLVLVALLLLLPPAYAVYGAQASRSDILFANFESAAYAPWRAEGVAFGSGPAAGTLSGQMAVTGFSGNRLINSFADGDAAQGRLVSPDFTVSRRYIAFLIGGGGFPERTCVNLVVAGKTICTASGSNTTPGGREQLVPSGWDVQEWLGQTAHLEIVDRATGGWGHILMDQITFTDTKPPLAAVLQKDISRTITTTGRWLNVPIRNGAPTRTITLRDGDTVIKRFQAPLADSAPDWWAFVDVSPWQKKSLTAAVDLLLENSEALANLFCTDQIQGKETLYQESLRPQFHFSAKRGWLNDPNGLIFANGEYHLFFQHSPFTWESAEKYWGHAVSKDLVHWTEAEEALAPDALGPMWSGSAVLDTQNTSGFGTTDKPPLVLIYTAASDPFTQCIAYSTDYRNFTKYAKNPVVGKVTAGNRDPRVFWHEPTKRWVMALYVEENRTHTVHFLTSPNLRDWTPASVFRGLPGTNFLYECPDLFPLALDGDLKKLKWILTGANTEYMIGSFDGLTFTPESSILPGVQGKGFYAPQTFNDEPKNRRIQIGWWQTETRDMPFNQSMSLPLELKLVSTANGPKLIYAPVPELESLRERTHALGEITVSVSSETDPLAAIKSELVEIRAEFTPEDADEVAFTVRGIPVIYSPKKQELSVNGKAAYAPLKDGKQRLTIYADRTGLEVFAADGLCFVSMPVSVKPNDKTLSLTVKGGRVAFDHLTVYELKSAWR